MSIKPQLFRRNFLAIVIASALSPVIAQADWNTNLITNPGAESAAGGNGTYQNNLPGWNVTGELTAVSYALGGPLGYPAATDPGPADRGANFFAGGNVASSSATQNIDLSFANSAINGSGAHFTLSGWLGGYATQEDNAQLSVSFLDAANNILGSANLGPVTSAQRGGVTAFINEQYNGWVPSNTASAQVGLQMTRLGGTANDGYADNLSLSLNTATAALSAPSFATVGSTFSVGVSALNPFGGTYTADELLGYGFNVGYDHSLLALTSVNSASGWDNLSGQIANVDAAGSVFPSITNSGQSSVDLAVLTFKVLAQGAASIDVNSNAASDFNQGLSYLNGTSTDIFGRTNISLITSVPEPSMIWLVLTGLSSIALLRKKNGKLV